jgi:hypothetical protein
MMDKVRMARTGTKKQGKQIKADKYMPKFADGGPVGQGGLPMINAQLPNQPVVPAASPQLTLNAPAPSNMAMQQATAQAQPAPANMADQYSAYRNNMLNQYAPTDANFLKQQYLNTLGRAPDQSGMDYWTKQLQSGVSPQDVAKSITGSDEAQHVAGIRQAMNYSNNPASAATPQTGMLQSQATNQISGLYQNLLGRAPDQAGLDFWTKAALGGQSIADITNAFKSSPEYLAKQNTSVPAATGVLGSVIRNRKR